MFNKNDIVLLHQGYFDVIRVLKGYNFRTSKMQELDRTKLYIVKGTSPEYTNVYGNNRDIIEIRTELLVLASPVDIVNWRKSRA